MIHLLRKLTLLVALVVLALCTVQVALAAPKDNGKSPNGNAWGQTSWSDGR
ncbi:MAG: hypothetical protein QOE36_729 [Gaiellaceae bacterium]|nr:hypothetical protein [Gaiellaceae bacterium]